MESMNLSPKGGPKLRDEVVSMNPQKRHLQTTKGTGVAVHQGVHLTVDSHDSLMEPGEDVTEEIKEQHGRGKERGRKENQVPVRIHKVPPLERTEIQCIKPGNSKGKKLQQEAHIYTCTPLTYTHMHTHAHPSHTHVHTHTCVLSYTHKRAHGHTCTHTHIHSHKCICSHTHTNNLPTYTHSHVHPPTHTHTHTHRKDIWFDDVELEMVDGEPVLKRPHVESTHVPSVTRSDERYIHTVHMYDTSLQLAGYLNINVQMGLLF